MLKKWKNVPLSPKCVFDTIWIPYLLSPVRHFFYFLIDHLILSLLPSDLKPPFSSLANDPALNFTE